MKTIVLKLTDQECRLVNNETHIRWVESCIEDGLGGVIEVLDADKFEKFLIDEMCKNTLSMKSEEEEYINLKSILSKLEKAVIQNDEPKCTKCGSKFEDEIWKTPATDYEEYICSNDKCCAVHTISINTELDDDGERGDIERFWDTLEFSYIWEQGLKKDEPKDELLDKAKALIKAIDDNRWESDGGVQNDEPKIDKNLLTQMQLSDFRDKLIELGENEYVEWVEKVAYKNLK